MKCVSRNVSLKAFFKMSFKSSTIKSIQRGSGSVLRAKIIIYIFQYNVIVIANSYYFTMEWAIFMLYFLEILVTVNLLDCKPL